MAAVGVPCGVGKIFSLYIKIVLIFFPYSGRSGILCSDGKWNTFWARAVGVVVGCCAFH